MAHQVSKHRYVVCRCLTYHPGTAVRRLCYEKFEEAFPDDYQDILSAYSEAHHIGAASTLNQRLQSFQKLYRRVASLVWHLVVRIES